MTVQGHERVLDGVLGSLATAQHDDSETEKSRVVPPEQHLDELGAGRARRQVTPAVGRLLTHGEVLLWDGVRHARESFDRSSG